MREELQMKGRRHEAAELRSKREAAVIEAETKYQQRDPSNGLQCSSWINRQCRSEKEAI